jgi:hypothetical protein
VKLGGPKLKQAQRNGWKTNTVNAERFAANVLPVIEKIKASGTTSLRAIAAELTARNIPTARGTQADRGSALYSGKSTSACLFFPVVREGKRLNPLRLALAAHSGSPRAKTEL